MIQSSTIVNKIKHVEDSINNNLYRIGIIEEKLKKKLLTTENRKRLENELEEIKKVLKKNKEKLEDLRYESSKYSKITALVMSVFYLIWHSYDNL